MGCHCPICFCHAAEHCVISMEGEEMPGDPGAGVKETSGRDGGLGQSRAEVLAGYLDRGA